MGSRPRENLVVTVAAGYREAQIRPFIASLRNYSPQASLRLVVDRQDPEFQEAIRAWFPDCCFYLMPALPLRDFALKRKWARSILKRAARWSRSRSLAKRLLKINFLRHFVIRDLLASWNLTDANILLCDSRDLVFQGDPFRGEWPLLWTCEEDKRVEECGFNSRGLRKTAGEAAFLQARHFRIVCAGVIGGRATDLRHYLQRFTKIIEQRAPSFVLSDEDQGIHNYLVRLQPEFGFTVLSNGRLAANVAYTRPADLTITGDQVTVRNNPLPPAILHQYDRHPHLAALVQSRWANATPP